MNNIVLDMLFRYIIENKPLSEVMFGYVTWKQIRAMVTTHCFLNDIEVDTKEWDDLVTRIAQETGKSKGTLDLFLCVDLV